MACSPPPWRDRCRSAPRRRCGAGWDARNRGNVVDQSLRFERIDRVVGHKFRVEVVVAHRPRRRVRDAAGDDPNPVAVHPTELVAGI